LTPDDLARLDRDLPSLEALDAEMARRQGLVEMKVCLDGFGHKKGQIIYVSAAEAAGHETFGSAERTSDTKERQARADHVTKTYNLAPTDRQLCEELERRGWRETARGWVKANDSAG
jgi:hypothetical protein